MVHLLCPARRHCLNIFSLLHKKAKAKRKIQTKTTPACVCAFLRVERLALCELVRARGGEGGLEWRDPCVMSCELPLSPSSTVVASVPLIPTKNTKAGTVFTIGYEMAIILCFPPCDTLHAALCWWRLAVHSLCVPMTPSSPVLSLNASRRPLISKVHETKGGGVSPAHAPQRASNSIL